MQVLRAVGGLGSCCCGELWSRVGQLRQRPVLLAGLVATIWLVATTALGGNLESHKALVAHMNKCVYSAYKKEVGGYVKSGKVYNSVSEVFKDRQSRLGLQGFLNYDLPSDKASGHSYNEYYDEVLRPYVHRSGLNVLEIGVKMGGSIMLWRELFPKDATIYGVDIDPSVPQFEKDAHIKILAGVSSRDDLEKMTLDNLKFDVIVDDGDHHARSQILTLVNMWPLLKSDGVYIIEDVFNDCALLLQMHFFLAEHYLKKHENNPTSISRNKPTSLADVAMRLGSLPEHLAEARLWVTVHEDKTEERLFVAYPLRSQAREHVPRKVRCALGGAPGPPCEEVMVPCNESVLRSP